jgi:23S rRNA pseudouridine1911/1915/1917 synthase
MTPEPESARLRVPSELSGMRLDVALVRLLPRLSRTRIQELVKDGGVFLGGERATRSAEPVEAGQTIELRPVARGRARRGGPPGGALTVLFEDEHLVAIDKPPHQVVHPSSIVRGGTVSELALARWGALPALQGEDRPGIVHRLDAETSGVMVLAKSEVAAAALLRQFREREVEKTYVAIVLGVPRFDNDWIDLPLGRSPRRPDRVSVMAEGEGRPAQTHYRTIERYEAFALLECRPRTGRTHQIRVHLAAIDHPIVGDRVYPGRGARPYPAEAPPPQRHALHAAELALAHPVTGERLSFTAPLPPDLTRLRDWLRQNG